MHFPFETQNNTRHVDDLLPKGWDRLAVLCFSLTGSFAHTTNVKLFPGIKWLAEYPLSIFPHDLKVILTFHSGLQLHTKHNANIPVVQDLE